MVKLTDIADAIGMGLDFSCYYDRDKDTVVIIPEYDDISESDGIRELIDSDESDRFVHICNDSPFNSDWELMKDFVTEIEDDGQRDVLEQAISGKGAFRMFRILIESFGIVEEWYEFKNDGELRRAEQWCIDHDVPFDRR